MIQGATRALLTAMLLLLVAAASVSLIVWQAPAMQAAIFDDD